MRGEPHCEQRRPAAAALEKLLTQSRHIQGPAFIRRLALALRSKAPGRASATRARHFCGLQKRSASVHWRPDNRERRQESRAPTRRSANFADQAPKQPENAATAPNPRPARRARRWLSLAPPPRLWKIAI